MNHIFLSRPNWIYPECQDGLNNFLTLLKTQGLIPRTIGNTDYPSKSPMDAVIDLLYECEGAIILGFPQIRMKSGFVKDREIGGTVQFSTEWNHIEAGLAHALGLPLLIIHDINISRGIFDRGATNYFLYEKDFCDSSWGISPEIAGALTQWKLHLKGITKFTREKEHNNRDVPKVKWGCFTFPPDENLYCPMCFNNKGLKMLTTRVDIHNRICTSCGKKIVSG